MPVLKCKMCGGNLEVTDGQTVCTCEYCGTTQTVPLIDSDKKARLFNRANDYRLNNDFDRAYNTYEAIVSEDPNEAEAYWGMVLSSYGVEYVEDPKSHKRIPTCHRTLMQSVFSDRNYKKAIELADIESKLCYQDEAEELEKLQKSIISVSSKEELYDVFISYKESGSDGNRTADSVIAQDLYDDLTNRGLRVFFSRISLEDKFGQNYEPFIYNALRTAKVMLLVTTSNENSNAPWVRNEWLRFLDFVRNDSMKSLIPVTKDMDPYELPDELQKLQVLDLNKLGSRQDLIRGVMKIVGENYSINNKSIERKEKNLSENDDSRDKSPNNDVKEKEIDRKTDKKKQKAIILLIPLIVVSTIFFLNKWIIKSNYSDGVNSFISGDYESALVSFSNSGNYSDSAQYVKLIGYLDAQDYKQAIEYVDDSDFSDETKKAVYDIAYNGAKKYCDDFYANYDILQLDCILYFQKAVDMLNRLDGYNGASNTLNALLDSGYKLARNGIENFYRGGIAGDSSSATRILGLLSSIPDSLQTKNEKLIINYLANQYKHLSELWINESTDEIIEQAWGSDKGVGTGCYFPKTR
ncbi:MAG: toll/interleukin-1 receptor domain-containing protein [Erysipelotrichaceae bacterium]|nr:toll/interleukin-1 receptor domain-containing protein [Erysipelotrichaceae bacterium]